MANALKSEAVSRTHSQDDLANTARTLYPLKEAARRLGLTVWGLRAWVYSGKIASHKIGSKVCISEDEIARIISESERPASNVDKRARSGKKG